MIALLQRAARATLLLGRARREHKARRARRPRAARLVVGRATQVRRPRVAAVGGGKGEPDVVGRVGVAVDKEPAPHARDVVAAQQAAHLGAGAQRARRRPLARRVRRERTLAPRDGLGRVAPHVHVLQLLAAARARLGRAVLAASDEHDP